MSSEPSTATPGVTTSRTRDNPFKASTPFTHLTDNNLSLSLVTPPVTHPPVTHTLSTDPTLWEPRTGSYTALALLQVSLLELLVYMLTKRVPFVRLGADLVSSELGGQDATGVGGPGLFVLPLWTLLPIHYVSPPLERPPQHARCSAVALPRPP